VIHYLSPSDDRRSFCILRQPLSLRNKSWIFFYILIYLVYVRKYCGREKYLSGVFGGCTLVQPPWIRRSVFNAICLSMYVWMCAPLAPEQFDRFIDILCVRFIRHGSVPGEYEHSGFRNRDPSDESIIAKWLACRKWLEGFWLHFYNECRTSP
jgi:hypothetical protein